MKVAVLPGDGIGPEVLSSAVEAVGLLCPDIELLEADVGLDCFQRRGEYLPEDTLGLVKETDAVLFGAITSPLKADGYRSPILRMRKELDLYANLRPVRNPAAGIGLVDLDVMIVRENTEGMYTGDEQVTSEGVDLRRTVTRRASERICRFARDLALRHGRGRVTCVHKANVLRLSDGLFRDVFYEVMEGSDLEAKDMIVDAAAAALVSTPQELDVMVTLNLYGDILSDEAAALAGGLGIAPSANLGDHNALFEPVHGSAPDIAGKGIANPTAALLSAAMMMDHLKRHQEASSLRTAVGDVLASGQRTRDLGGVLSTKEFSSLVLGRIC